MEIRHNRELPVKTIIPGMDCRCSSRPNVLIKAGSEACPKKVIIATPLLIDRRNVSDEFISMGAELFLKNSLITVPHQTLHSGSYPCNCEVTFKGIFSGRRAAHRQSEDEFHPFFGYCDGFV